MCDESVAVAYRAALEIASERSRLVGVASRVSKAKDDPVLT